MIDGGRAASASRGVAVWKLSGHAAARAPDLQIRSASEALSKTRCSNLAFKPLICRAEFAAFGGVRPHPAAITARRGREGVRRICD